LDFLPYKNGHFSITAVVGPNGSGKSNISDAVRWVMGEQSMKALRGKKNEDVIFGGSETKGQLGAAEVTMVLDNSDGRLMADYPEITVSRRLYRSGEGEYYVNNNPVRLIDVHLLFAKAQFAQHSYSVVGQGMIDRLLTVGPAERKDFLDEASGIKEFQIKQHQADLKLSRTAENIEQAERLMQEVEPRLKILARQVKKLEKRQEVELKLRESQEKYYSSVYLANKRDLDSYLAKLSGVETEYRDAFKNLEEIQAELAELAHASTRQDIFAELQVKYQILIREKNDLERQHAIKDGQMHAEYNMAGRQNISWTENKVSELKLRHDSLAGQLAIAQTEANELARAILEKKNGLERIARDKNRRPGEAAAPRPVRTALPAVYRVAGRAVGSREQGKIRQSLRPYFRARRCRGKIQACPGSRGRFVFVVGRGRRRRNGPPGHRIFAQQPARHSHIFASQQN